MYSNNLFLLNQIIFNQTQKLISNSNPIIQNYISFPLQNNLILSNYLFQSPSPYFFLQKKRNLNENESNLFNQCDYKKKFCEYNNIYNTNIYNSYIYNYNSIYIGNYYATNNIFDVHNNLIKNNDENYITKNIINKNKINEDRDKSNHKNEKINNNGNEFLKNSSNNIKPIKSQFFKVINVDTVEYKQKLILENKKNFLKNVKKNNEVKVLKYKKLVYINTHFLNSSTTLQNMDSPTEILFIRKKKRSSRYRGVSKNGKKWQVLAMFNKSKNYIGSYNSEEYAAKIYDILSLKYRGTKAITNFKYNDEQIKMIKDTDIDIKLKNIDELIEKLI